MTGLFRTTTLLLSFVTASVSAQTDSLKQQIARLLTTKKADVGVAVRGLENNDTLSINNSRHFPMLSVFKFHIALAVLNKVDNGKLSLGQKIRLQKGDLLPNTWSPLREKYPNGNVEIPLAEILNYTVALSDNNGCDRLLRLIGGPKTVNDYIHKLGISDVVIRVTEEEMHKSWDVQYINWTTPTAAVDLLRAFYDRKAITKESYEYLWKTLSETTTGKNRLKGQLPTGTVVAHKTGTSDTNGQGVTAAINDIGIVTLPNGDHFAISVFVANSKETTDVNEKIIADVAKLTWDYFTAKAK